MEEKNRQGDIIERLAFLKQDDTLVPSADCIDLILEALRGRSELPIGDVSKLYEYACIQCGRWGAEWSYSPLHSPNHRANCEEDKWSKICDTLSSALLQARPGSEGSELLKKQRGLIVFEPILKRAVQYAEDRPIEGLLMRLYARAGIMLSGWGLHTIGHTLYQRGLFPTWVVGHPSNTRKVHRVSCDDVADEEQSKDKYSKSLHRAAESGAIEAAVEALRQGADVNFRTDKGCTPLMAAALNANDDMVTLLLSKNADLNARDHIGSTALHFACMHGSPSTVRMLLDAGANPEARDSKGAPPFFDAVLLENLGVLRWLHQSGASLASRNDAGLSLLHVAASVGRTEVLRFLHDSGLDLETRSLTGETPLLSSLSHSEPETARYLLAHGANIHAVDARRATALHHAAFGGLVSLCESLLRSGLSPHAQDSSGRTPLHVAASKGFPTIQRLFVEAGAQISLKDFDGKTVSDLEEKAADLRWLTDVLRLLRALPGKISMDDAKRLSDLFDMNEHAAEDRKESTRLDIRYLLDDLVHAYKTDPSRVGLQQVSLAPILDNVEKIHKGETD